MAPPVRDVGVNEGELLVNDHQMGLSDEDVMTGMEPCDCAVISDD